MKTLIKSAVTKATSQNALGDETCRIVEEVVMLPGFEGTANVTSQGAKGDGADEAIGGRTTFG